MEAGKGVCEPYCNQNRKPFCEIVPGSHKRGSLLVAYHSTVTKLKILSNVGAKISHYKKCLG